MDNILYWLYLSFLKKFAADDILALISYFGSAKNIYDATERDLIQCKLLSKAGVNALRNKDLRRANSEFLMARQLGVSLVCLTDNEYPELLRHIPAPPILLYVRGNLSVLKDSLSIGFVGSRSATAYGITQTLRISTELAGMGVNVISGLAVGVDGAAHKGALNGGGYTVGVMGCGIDVDYPKEHANLKEQIIRHGAIISEYPFKTRPYPQNFPVRNRIISGLSHGVVICEAGRRSGSIITATKASGQGREVFAIPGNIDTPHSVGSNLLLRDGAKVVIDTMSILDEYTDRYPEYFNPGRRAVPVASGAGQAPAAAVTAVNRDLPKIKVSEPMTGDEERLLKYINKEEISVDKLIELSGMPASKVNALLTMLVIKGGIEELKGRRYRRL